VLRVPSAQRGCGWRYPRRLCARWYRLQRDLLSGEGRRRPVGHHDLDLDAARAPHDAAAHCLAGGVAYAGERRGDGAEYPAHGPRTRARRFCRSLHCGQVRGKGPADSALDLGAGHLLRAAGRRVGLGRQDPDLRRPHHRGRHLPQPARLPLRLPGRTRRPRLGQGLAHNRNRGWHAELGAGRDAGEDPLRLHSGDRAPCRRFLRVAQPVRRAAGSLLPPLEERRPGLNGRVRGGGVGHPPPHKS